jgi:hypothetical protein
VSVQLTMVILYVMCEEAANCSATPEKLDSIRQFHYREILLLVKLVNSNTILVSVEPIGV